MKKKKKKKKMMMMMMMMPTKKNKTQIWLPITVQNTRHIEDQKPHTDQVTRIRTLQVITILQEKPPIPKTNLNIMVMSTFTPKSACTNGIMESSFANGKSNSAPRSGKRRISASEKLDDICERLAKVEYDYKAIMTFMSE